MRKVAGSLLLVSVVCVLVAAGCDGVFQGCGQTQDKRAKPGSASSPAVIDRLHSECDRFCDRLLKCKKDAMSMEDCRSEWCPQLKLHVQEAYVQEVYSCLLGCAAQNQGQGYEVCMESAFKGCKKTDEASAAAGMVCDKVIKCKLLDTDREQCVAEIGEEFGKWFSCLNKSSAVKMIDCIKTSECPDNLPAFLQSCLGKISGR